MISGNFHIFDVYCWHVQLKCDFPKLFLVKIICYTNSIHIFCSLFSHHELQLEDYRLPQSQKSMWFFLAFEEKNSVWIPQFTFFLDFNF